MKFGHDLLPRWLLEDGIRFLNHGSYGAAPRVVLAAQSDWRDRMERQPVRFMNEELGPALRAAAARVAAFVGAAADDLVFVENATTAVNAVLRSRRWRAGDEIALMGYAYPAVRNATRYVARQQGLAVREVDHPFPIAREDQLVDAFAAALSPRTALAVVDHISSPLAIVYPVERLVALCRERGIPVLVDGAHAPGMVPLDLQRLGADWYTGNCHKWLFAPKGCAFLWAAPAAQEGLHPLAISNHWGEGYLAEFDWTGTRDPSAWLSVTAAIDFWQECETHGGSDYRHRLALAAAGELACAWQTALPAPASMYGAMITLPLPWTGAATLAAAQGLHDRLWRDLRVEVPVLCFDGRLWVRISAQVYNEAGDYAPLATV